MEKIDYELTKQHFNTKIYRSYLLFVSEHYPSINLSEVCDKAGLSYDYVFKSDGWVSIEFNYRFMMELKKHIHDPHFEHKVGQKSFSKELMGPVFHIMKNILTLEDIYNNIWKFTKYFNKVMSFKAVRNQRGHVVIKMSCLLEELSPREKDQLKASLPDIVNNSLGYYAGFSKAKSIDHTKVSAVRVNDFEYDIEIKYPLETYKIFDTLAIGLSGAAAYYAAMSLTQSYWESGLAAVFVSSLYFSWKIFRRNRTFQEAVNQSEDTLNKLDTQYKNLVEAKLSLQRRLTEAEAINELTNTLIQTSTQEEIVQNAAAKLTSILRFDRVIILLRDDEEKFLNVKALSISDPSLEMMASGFRLPIDIQSEDRTKVSNIYRFGQPVFIEDVILHMDSLNEESRHFVKASRSKSFIGVAIKSKNHSYGVILADTCFSDRKLTKDDVSVLNLAGQQLAIALEKHQAQAALAVAYDNLNTLAESYSRFVPFETIRLLGFKSVLDIKINQGIELNMAIVFCDIRGFTSLSETMSPPEAMNFLNSYFSNLAPIFQQHSGMIDKFMGDGIMALFVEPKNALKAAAQFQKELRHYNLRNQGHEHFHDIRTGMGIHLGKVLLGAVGYEDRLSISVVSDAVNLTSRLDGLTKKFGVDILCSETIYAQMDDVERHDLRLIARLRVEGRREFTNIYEYFGHLSAAEKDLRRTHRLAIEELIEGRLPSATPLATGIDPVLEHYLAEVRLKLVA